MLTCAPTLSSTQCSVHGGEYFPQTGKCQTLNVLAVVAAERARQFAQYGTNEDLADGTGTAWMRPYTADGAPEIEAVLRTDYEAYEACAGAPTWMHLVREEVAEAFAETDEERLRAELIQVAALCVSWVEKMDAR